MEYTIKQASEALNVSTDTIRRRIKEGKIRAHKVEGKNGLQWVIPEAELTGANGTQIIEVIPVKREMNAEILQSYIRDALTDVLEASETRHNEQMEALKEQVKELTETVQALNKALGTTQEEPKQAEEPQTKKRWWKPWAKTN